MKEVFKQYDNASKDKKVDIVTNIVLQNHMCVLNIFPNILFVTVLCSGLVD